MLQEKEKMVAVSAANADASVAKANTIKKKI